MKFSSLNANGTELRIFKDLAKKIKRCDLLRCRPMFDLIFSSTSSKHPRSLHTPGNLQLASIKRTQQSRGTSGDF